MSEEQVHVTVGNQGAFVGETGKNQKMGLDTTMLSAGDTQAVLDLVSEAEAALGSLESRAPAHPNVPIVNVTVRRGERTWRVSVGATSVPPALTALMDFVHEHGQPEWSGSVGAGD